MMTVEPKSPETEFSERDILTESYTRFEMNLENLARNIDRIVADPDRFIARGGAGVVYELSVGTCLKVLEPRENSIASELMDVGNSVARESTIQHYLAGVTVAGVRSPDVFGYWRSNTPQIRSAIVMEELDAENSQFVLNGDAPLPEAFELELFFDALFAFIDHMHAHKQIAHADIAPRNVMIDRQTGLPRVIDFGRSKPIPSSDAAAQRLMNADYEAIDDFDLQMSRFLQRTENR